MPWVPAAIAPASNTAMTQACARPVKAAAVDAGPGALTASPEQLAVLGALELAHWMARMHSRLGHALLLMAVIAPLLTGIVVRTFAWMTVLGDRGVINVTLQSFGLIEKPLPLMYNEFGVIVGLVHIYVPFMVLTLVGYNSSGRTFPVRLESKRTHGRGRSERGGAAEHTNGRGNSADRRKRRRVSCRRSGA